MSSNVMCALIQSPRFLVIYKSVYSRTAMSTGKNLKFPKRFDTLDHYGGCDCCRPESIFVAFCGLADVSGDDSHA